MGHGGSGEYGIGMNVATPAETRNLAESNLCGGSPATVTDVEFVTSSHLSMLAFGLRRYPIVAGGYTVDELCATTRVEPACQPARL